MMMWRAFKNRYDRESDTLYLYDSRVAPTASLLFGDGQLVIDYGSGDALSSIEILDASTYLKNALGSEAPSRKKLSQVSAVRVDLRREGGVLFLRIALSIESHPERVRLNVQVPQATKIAI